MKNESLSTETELNDLLAADGPVWVLKHSNTCPVSTYAKQEFDAYVNDQDATAGIVVVQEARDLSNRIAERFDITHESPQAFLFVDGEVKWHASHGAILADEMKHAAASFL